LLEDRELDRLPIYQVDAFTKRRFGGNPAAVVPLQRWLGDALMQAIAGENNLSETAFFVPHGEAFRLRWFTPSREVKLCGHATLASAFVLFNELEPDRRAVCFETLSGPLRVTMQEELLAMDFPAAVLRPVAAPPAALLEGLGLQPREVLTVESEDNFVAVLDDEAQVRAVRPDFRALESLHPAGVAVTARGEDSDCASRYFAPSYGVPEDPATGSIHCALAPYWSRRLGKARIVAHQVSSRGAELDCEARGERVVLRGRAVKYLSGWIDV
jgi:PhzF family phenazine biosynthesis protein